MIIAISPTREFLVKQAEIHNLYWHGYRFSSLPLNFEHYDNLVELNLPGSSIKRLWEGRKNLLCLIRMDLSNSKELMETPILNAAQVLRCTKLLHVHPSIGLLKQLAYLSLQNGSSL
ncbi:hypothetical protein Ahy_B08g093245 [Arachis hypogaea]|uniref:Disease resistance protein n=1 Tax=Arachis hypogaea TaxID=3818 RepID=A0A444Y5N1_ARAHY|nr:hypothetical protein Ahy_B08g093245 [Arachis hypogaea]